MGMRTTTCYIPFCDGCRHEIDCGDYIPHYDNEKRAIEDTENYDWIVIDGRLYCEDCRHLAGLCANCKNEDGDAHERDDHDPATGTCKFDDCTCPGFASMAAQQEAADELQSAQMEA